MRICWSELPDRGKWLLPLMALAVVGAVASGCGSGADDETSARPAAAEPPGQPLSPDSTRSDEGSGQTGKQGSTTKAPVGGNGGGKSSDGKRRGSSSKPPSGSRSAKDGGRLATSNARRCPSGVSTAECKAIAEQRSDEPSYSVTSVEECVEAIGKEQCERFIATQNATGDPPISVAKCLEQPTPRCEKALRPILEAEPAASNAKK